MQTHATATTAPTFSSTDSDSRRHKRFRHAVTRESDFLLAHATRGCYLSRTHAPADALERAQQASARVLSRAPHLEPLDARGGAMRAEHGLEVRQVDEEHHRVRVALGHLLLARLKQLSYPPRYQHAYRPAHSPLSIGRCCASVRCARVLYGTEPAHAGCSRA
eukprot:1566111-Rhodomonas_salina.3